MPAKLVEVTPEYVPDGDVECVAIQSIRSFVYDQVIVPVLPLDSSLHVDVVYTDNSFAPINSDQLDLSVEL